MKNLAGAEQKKAINHLSQRQQRWDEKEKPHISKTRDREFEIETRCRERKTK